MCEIAVKEEINSLGMEQESGSAAGGRSLKRAEKDDRATVERQLLACLERAGSGDLCFLLRV